MKTALDLNLIWQGLFVLMVTIFITAMPEMAFATDTSGDDSYGIGYVMCNAVGFFFGNAGKGLGTIAIAVIGVGALFGKVSWGLATIVGVGIGIIFGSRSIFKAMSGYSSC